MLWSGSTSYVQSEGAHTVIWRKQKNWMNAICKSKGLLRDGLPFPLEYPVLTSWRLEHTLCEPKDPIRVFVWQWSCVNNHPPCMCRPFFPQVRIQSIYACSTRNAKPLHLCLSPAPHPHSVPSRSTTHILNYIIFTASKVPSSPHLCTPALD